MMRALLSSSAIQVLDVNGMEHQILVGRAMNAKGAITRT